MSTTIPSPTSFDLTPQNLIAFECEPLVAGDFAEYRFQARSDGAAVNLTGCVVVLSVRRHEKSTTAGDLLLQRRSQDDLVGWSGTPTNEITLDDQATEDAEAETGTGWWRMTFTPGDQDELLDAIGLYWYDVRALFTDGKIHTLLRGRIEILPPRTLNAQFT